MSSRLLHRLTPSSSSLYRASQSPILKENTILANHFQLKPMKNSYISSPVSDLDELSSRGKWVRFEDEDSFGADSQATLALSRGNKKPVSILKKSNSIDKLSVNSGNSDLGHMDFLNPKNSLKDKGLACSNDKYTAQLKTLKYQNIKYFDKLFPPGGASLCYSKQKIAQFKNVRWMRIQDLFKGKKLVLYNQHHHSKCTYTMGGLQGCNFAVACNLLANSNRSLQRIFQDQRPIGLCIYYLRTNQDGIWKYTIIDDYIPVINSKGVDMPAFLNVSQNHYGQVQIWPLLLQKAFAKIYGCYQSLMDDCAQNLLFDFTGFPSEGINLMSQADQFKFRSSITHSHSVALVSQPYNPSCFQDKVYPVRQEGGMTSSAYFSLDTRMKLIDLRRNGSISFDINDLRKEFRRAELYQINDSYYSLGCIIKQAKGTISLRKFSIKERTGNCILNLIEKDKKYYHNNGYAYVWTRIMVVVKDGDNGYRWVDGSYQNRRVNSLYLNLEPGQYLILMNGDWREKVFEMYLNYQGNQEVEFQRQTIDKYPNIMTEMCVDIAQRFGTLRQINRNICSYSLIDRKNGFLIQNVNNEVSRPVFYHKIYKLVGKQYQLMERQKYLQEQENAVQIKIMPGSHFTFIAKLVNGFDSQLLGSFSFD